MRLHNRLTPFLYLTPALILFGVFTLYPLGRAVQMSFQQYNILKPDETRYVGLANYREAVGDPKVQKAFQNTLFPIKSGEETWGGFAKRIPRSYTLMYMPLAVVLPLLLAFLIDRLRRQVFMRVVTFLPVVVSGAVVAVLWTTLYHPSYGPITAGVEKLFGVKWNFLGEESTAMISLVAMTVWQGMGFNVLLFLVTLANIPDELYEAASVDGAGRWRTFLHVTLPLLKPGIYLVTVLSLIGAMRVFGPMFIMTNGGPGNATLSVMMYVYQQAFQFGYLRFGYAAAMAIMLAMLIMFFAICSSRLNRPVDE